MKKVMIWIAVGMIGLGIALFVGLGIAVKFDFMRFDTMKYVTNSFDITEDFDSVNLDTINADVEFVISEDGKCRVECFEREKLIHDVKVLDGTLTIHAVDSRNWIDHITVFNFRTPKITVYLPAGEYHMLKVKNTTGDLKLTGAWKVEILSLKSTTGDISLNQLTVRGQANVEVTTGNICMNSCTAGSLSLDGSCGDVTLKDVLVSGDLRAVSTTGDMKLERCDADEIYLKTTTGSVTATLLTEKMIFAKTTTGTVDVPKLTTGGQCEITTTTGDISVKNV